MINNINLLNLSNEQFKSRFPSLYNSNITTISDAINANINALNQETTTLSSISGSLNTSVLNLSASLDADIYQLSAEIGNLSNTFALRSDTVSISSGLQDQIDVIQQSISGVIDISGFNSLAEDVSDNLASIRSISGDLQNKIDLLDDTYATDQSVTTVNDNLQGQIDTINNDILVIPSISGNTVTNATNISSLQTNLSSKLDTTVFASISGSKDPSGSTINGNLTINSFDKTHPVNLSGSSTISLSGSPIEGNYLTFFDVSNNINTNTLSISGQVIDYVFNDNKGSLTLEYRNNNWNILESHQTKFIYDDNNNISVNPSSMGILANKLSTGSYSSPYSVDMEDSYNLESNVVDNGLFFINANTPNANSFNVGNYNNDENTPYEITASSHQSNLFPWRAFDGQTSPSSNGWVSNQSSGWIVIDLDSDVRQFTNFRFFNGDSNDDRPVDIIVDASNNALNWDVIANVSGDTTPVTTWSNMINLSTTKTYRYYRINIQNNNGGSNIRIVEIDFREGVQTSTNNNFDFIMYNGNPKSFSPSTLNIFDKDSGYIIGQNKVNISYSINNGSYSSVLDLEDFKLLNSIDNVSRIDFKLQLIGSNTFTSASINEPTSFVEQTSSHIRLVNSGDNVFNVSQSGDINANTLNVNSISISGGNMDASTISYSHPTYTNIEDALNTLLYIAPDISAMSISINSYTGYKEGNILEQGSEVTDLDINWTLNKSLNGGSPTATLNQSIGSVTTLKGPNVENYNVTFTSNKTFTLSVSEIDPDSNTQTDSRNSSVSFRWKAYWGVSSSPSLNNSDVLSLGNEALLNNNNRSFTLSPSAQYIYFVSPQSFGTASFVVGGLSVTFNQLSLNSFINSSNGTTNYYVYRSQSIQNGSNISIEVS